MNNTVSNHAVPAARLDPDDPNPDDVVMATLEQFDPAPPPPPAPLAGFRRGVVNVAIAVLAVGLVLAALAAVGIGVRWLDASTLP